MTVPTARAVASPLRRVRVARLVPVAESGYPGRIPAQLAMVAIQVFLYYCLWSAVYAGAGTVAGTRADQVVTYAVLAVLCSRIRWSFRSFSRDALPMQVRDGSIGYWFLRPLPPQRYYVLRALGDGLLGGALMTLAYLFVLGFGIVTGPASAGAGWVALFSVLLGQVLLYQIGLAIDLTCFWLVTNDSVNYIHVFLQDLFAGVFVPLWLMPSWLSAVANALPFQAAINVPLSFYIGRLPLRSAPRELAVQIVWVVVFSLTTRLLWRAAGKRVMVQGG